MRSVVQVYRELFKIVYRELFKIKMVNVFFTPCKNNPGNNFQTYFLNIYFKVLIFDLPAKVLNDWQYFLNKILQKLTLIFVVGKHFFHSYRLFWFCRLVIDVILLKSLMILEKSNFWGSPPIFQKKKIVTKNAHFWDLFLHQLSPLFTWMKLPWRSLTILE